MDLQIEMHPTGELRAVSINPADYDALLALGYPDASHWRIGSATGRPNVICPFTGECLPIALLLKRFGDRELVHLIDGDPLNLLRDNLQVVTGKANATVRNARRSIRRALATFHERMGIAA